MRLDKYLKVARLIKRRTVANDACDGDRVTVNGREAKASYQVKVGDVIGITFGNRSVRVKVLNRRPCCMKSCPPKNKPPKGECLMGMYRRNVTAAVENKIQEDHPKTGKREKDYLRSLIFLFIIVAIAATVADFRREPVLDGERQDFVILAEAAIEQRKADFWLGG